MTKENYDKMMGYLDIIEEALNSVAVQIGHCDFKTFVENGYKSEGRASDMKVTYY